MEYTDIRLQNNLPDFLQLKAIGYKEAIAATIYQMPKPYRAFVVMSDGLREEGLPAIAEAGLGILTPGANHKYFHAYPGDEDKEHAVLYISREQPNRKRKLMTTQAIISPFAS